MSLFTTFGTFSIAAGILLIFLIFVMLAAERRGELGIARAVGTRRGHLVQMFTFEGAAYDVIAAAVGALLGAAIAYGMVLVIASAFERRAKRLPDRVLRVLAQPLRRLRDRRAAHAARRRVLRLARERDDDLGGDPKPSRAARSTSPPETGARTRHDRTRRSAHDERCCRRSGDAADARRLPRADRPRSATASGARVGASGLYNLRPCDRRHDASALERLGIRVRADLDGLHDVDRGWADDRDRHDLGDRLQRRPGPARSQPASSRGSARPRRWRGWRSRTRCGRASARARRWRCSRSSCSRSSRARRRRAPSSRRSATSTSSAADSRFEQEPPQRLRSRTWRRRCSRREASILATSLVSAASRCSR